MSNPDADQPAEVPAEAGGPATDAPQPRRIGGRYRLDRVLGWGAMGVVWAAYDEMLRRPVAVKEVRLPPGIPAVEAEELRERTMREARAIAVLSHPNVVTLHDVVQQDDEPFVVMELIPSCSLASLVRRHGPLDTGQAAAVADAVASALDAAHQAGITHRDVKPGNVLVGRDGRIKLTDFGIARNMAEKTITSTGVTLGSPAFIAPEVAAGDPTTPAADLWSLGATLFSAVEGRPPYDVDGDPLETVSQVVHGEVPEPGDGPLAPVIRGLMTKDPARRMSLTEVRRALRPLLPEPGTQVFDPAELDDVERAGGTQLEVPVVPVEPVPVGGPTAEPPAESAPLAADPGPLPFLPREPTPPSRLRRVGLIVLAVLLFLVTAAGGFALTRVVAGHPLIPRAELIPVTDSGTTLKDLVRREDTAEGPTGGGSFAIQAPAGWDSFRAQPTEGMFGSVLRYVSPDGRRELAVERLAGFYGYGNISSYLRQLQKRVEAGPNTFVKLFDQVVPGLEGGNEPAREVLYRTEERGHTSRAQGNDSAHRSTIARLVPHGADLWVVRVTVPVEEEDRGRTEVYDRLAPTFRITD
ncbi:serine/threonine protein kinase [Longimycelium tulufanense]|uniref:non-specific serine/threonine protein kinase n=1 Tax=Longimycelium tulufanense TaxID=907463 RepID=A0A8J3CGM0_9PSEU|nr:serine/threonine-protein kinase [Longimycelium tulufanense]GGM65829.1 serine/threonine protein kinase [Longimycelium tulufanense]